MQQPTEIDATALERAWAAGLFEGEGCISAQHVEGYSYARVSLGMTDEDPVRRFHRAVGCGSVNCHHSPSTRAKGHKAKWLWRTDKSVEVQAVIELLWWGLGERRRARAIEVLAMAAASPKRTLKTHCVHGHAYTLENTIVRGSRKGERRCRECARRASREYLQRRRAAT